jgi:hypothetical protein
MPPEPVLVALREIACADAADHTLGLKRLFALQDILNSGKLLATRSTPDPCGTVAEQPVTG